MKKIILFALAAVMLIAPAVWAEALTQEELLAEIARLQALITQLNSQVTPTACSATFTRDFTIGSTGEDVTQLIKILAAKGFYQSEKLASSGISVFAEEVAEALAKYQTAVGISPASGYFGPVTRAHLNAVLGCENKNDAWISVNKYQVKSGENFEFTFAFPEAASYGEFVYRCNGNDLELNAKGGAYCEEKSTIDTSIPRRINLSVTATNKSSSSGVDLGGEIFAYDKDGRQISKAIVWVTVGPAESVQSAITILTPKENETYDVGDKIKITWTPKKAEVKQIALICSGTCSSDYLVYQPKSTWFRTSSGVRNYQIPRKNFQPGYYRVRITLNDGTMAESPVIRILGEDEEEEDDDTEVVSSCANAPYQVKNAAGRCAWSCGAGTTPDNATGKCVCEAGLVRGALDSRGRLTCAAGALTREQARPSPFAVTQAPSEEMQTPETGSVCALGVNNSGWGSGSSQSTRDYCSSAKSGGWAVRCLKGPSLRAYQVPISSQGQSGDQICASSGGVCTEVNSGPWGQKYCDDTSDTYGWSARCVIGSGLSAFSTNNEAGQSGDQVCDARSAKCVSVNDSAWGHKYCYEPISSGGWSIRCVRGDGLSAADANTSSTNPSGDQACAARVAQAPSRARQTASIFQAISSFLGLFGRR